MMYRLLARPVFCTGGIPQKIAPEAADTFVAVRGFDRCLIAYLQHLWEETAGKILRLPQTERNVRGFFRGMLSQAAEVRLDRQARAIMLRKLLARTWYHS